MMITVVTCSTTCPWSIAALQPSPSPGAAGQGGAAGLGLLLLPPAAETQHRRDPADCCAWIGTAVHWVQQGMGDRSAVGTTHWREALVFGENALLKQLELAKARARLLFINQNHNFRSSCSSGQWISRNLGWCFFVSIFISSLEPAGPFPVFLWCVSSWSPIYEDILAGRILPAAAAVCHGAEQSSSLPGRRGRKVLSPWNHRLLEEL